MRSALILVVALSLFGCADVETDRGSYSGDKNTLQTSSPASLRALQTSSLELQLVVNGASQIYQGSDFADGVWSISLDLPPQRNHEIDLKWYSYGHLVLHETGTFFAGFGNEPITLDLEFSDDGNDGFDDDCDGISNLVELTNGTPVGPVGGSTCQPDESLINPEVIYLVKNFQSFFESGYQERVTRFEQVVRVQALNPERSVSYWVKLTSFDTETAGFDATVELSSSQEFAKHLYFEIESAIGAEPDLIGTCGVLNDTRYFCRVPFDWKTQHWYNLRLELVEINTWEASVVDMETGQVQNIGRIQTVDNTVWDRPRFGMGYLDAITDFQTCQSGLPRIAMQAQDGLANGVSSAIPTSIALSSCVDAGPQWRAGTRARSTGNIYSLSVGN